MKAGFNHRPLPVRELAFAFWLAAGYGCIVQPCFSADESFVRANQLGYQIHDPKIAIAFGNSSFPDSFSVLDFSTGKKVFGAAVRVVTNAVWGQFSNHVELDFSSLTTVGKFEVRIGEARSLPFVIAHDVYSQLPDDLLEFMREQRCGYNPWLHAACHTLDGRTAYGARPNGSVLDVRGGWHDAGDLLKYLLTSGNATAQLLLAYQLGHAGGVKFKDAVTENGQTSANRRPDILDEARWGLEWLLKLHPSSSELYHQVADDRDHAGWRLPQDETADYGWGKGGARVVYFADGKPQGLQKYQSASTGVANLAGRYAAAMALAYQIWKHDPAERSFAEQCLQAGKEVYELGRAFPGVQQGNSFNAPYRYEESTWADDMEWGAAELYRATHSRRFLTEAVEYARQAGAESWMGKEQTGHYQYYPFMNVGHFRLYEIADRQVRKLLAGFYRDGIERCIIASQKNPYRTGVPFIWCSNNLLVALVTQCLLYERMTGDKSYHEFAARQRDCLMGRNPWGYTMFTEIGSVYPKDPHLMTVQILKRPVRGGLVDGPVYEHIFKSLKGVSIREPDPLARFQGQAVFHDDMHDYSTDEPTMDGTASAILMWALWRN
jgi:endoglucanase